MSRNRWEEEEHLLKRVRPGNIFDADPPVRPKEVKPVNCSFCGERMGTAAVRDGKIITSVSPRATEMTPCKRNPRGTHSRNLKALGVE